MRPATLNLFGDYAVTAGDDYSLEVQVGGVFFSGVDLNEWTFVAQLRRRTGPYDTFGELTDPTAEFAVDVVADVDGAATLTLTLDAEVTAGLDSRRRWVWDLQAVDPDGAVHTLLTGMVTVRGEVTATVGGT